MSARGVSLALQNLMREDLSQADALGEEGLEPLHEVTAMPWREDGFIVTLADGTEYHVEITLIDQHSRMGAYR